MFRTELPIAPATGQLPRTARVLTMGSCFADSIGARLVAHKVEALVNPFGTVFQPLVLGQLLRAAAGEEVDWQQHLVQARGRWQSYDLHGSIGAESPVDLLQTIQELVRRTGEFLRQADVVLLTLGTAWAYRLRETGELVNNCHKQPADLFVRELLTPDEIINNLAETHAYLRRINPSLRFVLTVSPVRHLKDTLPLNSVSKSVLRVATHVLSDLLPGVAYFPAYELLMDDLRDYRFYAADMLHPSEVAEDYIWDKFARTYFDTEFGRFRKEWAAVRNSLAHRPLHAGAPEHRQFLENTLEKLEQFSLRKVKVDAELQEVRSKLASLPVPREPEPVELPEDDEERIDIGESVPSPATMALPAKGQGDVTTPEGRPTRLSPEEFRSQRAARPERGRRDGRGKGQPQLPTENEQFQAVTSANDQTEMVSAASPVLFPTELGIAEQLLEASAAPAVSALAENAGVEEPAKKKKRRSRGGAKRTARKHALRLAAGEGTSGDEGAPIAETAAELNVPAADSPENKKSSVITKSVPVKRGVRRNEARAVPRIALFAPAADISSPEGTPLAADAEAPQVAPVLPAAEVPAIIREVTSAAVVAAAGKSRSSRNRGRKVATSSPGDNSPALEAEASRETGDALGAPTPVATATSGAADVNNEPGEALSESAAPIGAAVTSAQAPRSTPARRSNRTKRAISGARAQKPDVDVPVVPVPNERQARTQVAAGRMTGSSASLIEPAAETTPPKKKAAAPKKTATPRKAAPKATKTAEPAAPAEALTEAPTSAPKRKSTSKPKAASTKAAAPKPRAPKKPAKPTE